MRFPKKTPQLFHDAVLDFLNALDVSIDRIAPFAGLQPSSLRRLGKDGKHHTLVPAAIVRLIEAPPLVGKSLEPEPKDAWEKHLKIASLYTNLVILAHHRTKSAWPQTPQDYQVVWNKSSDLVIYSDFSLFHGRDESYQNRDIRGFREDSVFLWKKWAKNELESEENIVSTLNEIDKAE